MGAPLFYIFSLQKVCHRLLLPFEFTTRILSGDGEPEVATTIDYEGVTCRNVQTRERGTVGIVAGGIDGITRAINLGREGHIAQIVAADGYAGDGCRGSDAAA